jgi:AraC-like DNA-binding protein
VVVQPKLPTNGLGSAGRELDAPEHATVSASMNRRIHGRMTSSRARSRGVAPFRARATSPRPMGPLPEIDSPPRRAVLGAGVKLRRLCIDEAIDVWIMEYRRTRGLRLSALADRFEIGVQLDGRFRQRTHRGGAHVFERGTVHVVGAGEVYDVAYDAGDESGRIVWFTVDARPFCEADDDRELDLVATGPERCDELREVAEQILATGTAGERLTRDIQAAVHRYFARRAELSPATPVAAARREIERHFQSDLYLMHVADAVGLHPVTLLRQFARRYGTTPIQYRIKRRLNFADRLLWARPELSVKEVAVQAAFDNPSHFYKKYVAYLGVTPLRRRHLVS